MRILLVEDEEDLRFLIGTALAVDGHETVGVRTGEEALAADGDFDLILLDVRLPGMDGFELLEHLDVTRAVMMSAHGDAEVAERAAACGVAGYLAKPFRLAELRHLVTALAEELPAIR